MRTLRSPSSLEAPLTETTERGEKDCPVNCHVAEEASCNGESLGTQSCQRGARHRRGGGTSHGTRGNYRHIAAAVCHVRRRMSLQRLAGLEEVADLFLKGRSLSRGESRHLHSLRHRLGRRLRDVRVHAAVVGAIPSRAFGDLVRLAAENVQVVILRSDRTERDTAGPDIRKKALVAASPFFLPTTTTSKQLTFGRSLAA